MTTGIGATPARARARDVIRSRPFRLTARILVGGGVLAAIVARVGTGPFVHGLLSLDAPAIVAAVLLYGVATAAAAWRWRLIARRLGLELHWPRAVGMYYRSQFLNTVLPGGMIGDVDRAAAHGRSTESAGASARAVILERTVGQIVQLGLAVVVVVLTGASGAGGLLIPVAGFGLAALGVLAIPALAAAMASSRVRRAVLHEIAELRAGLGSAAASAQAAAASVVVVGCHVAIFAIAARTVGADVPPARMLALAVVVLLAASIPATIGGWGPREGVAGWAFAMSGFGASTGVAAATLFGVLALIAVALGVIVTGLASLITGRIHRDRQALRDAQLRCLARRVHRLAAPAEAPPLESSGLRPGG